MAGCLYVNSSPIPVDTAYWQYEEAMFEMLFDELRRNKLTVENLPNTIFAISEKAILETIRLAYAVRYY